MEKQALGPVSWGLRPASYGSFKRTLKHFRFSAATHLRVLDDYGDPGEVGELQRPAAAWVELFWSWKWGDLTQTWQNVRIWCTLGLKSWTPTQKRPSCEGVPWVLLTL